jgi:hypothetical protein
MTRNGSRIASPCTFEFTLLQIRAFTVVRSPVAFCLNTSGCVYKG